MFCYNCGAKLKDDERFCYKCGTRVRDRINTASESGQSETQWFENASSEVTEETLAEATIGSCGEEMPSELNQYNYNGSPQAYFLEVLTEAFPEYTVRKDEIFYQSPMQLVLDYGGKYHRESGPSTPAYLYTVRDDETVLLAVEVLSLYSKSRKTNRHSFEGQGIPYIRFYYDADGWWNTKSYVTQRAILALENG